MKSEDIVIQNFRMSRLIMKNYSMFLVSKAYLTEIEKLEVTEDTLNTLMMVKKSDIQYNGEKQMEEDKASL